VTDQHRTGGHRAGPDSTGWKVFGRPWQAADHSTAAAAATITKKQGFRSVARWHHVCLCYGVVHVDLVIGRLVQQALWRFAMLTPCTRTLARNRFRPLLRCLEARDTPTVFTVTNTLDAGPGSLRQAVLDANALTGADSVAFSDVFASPQTISLLTALPVIEDSLTVNGPGADKLTVRRDDAATDFAVMSVISPTEVPIDVTINGMTITNGRASGNWQTGSGGGIQVFGGNLTLVSSRVNGNHAQFSGGGVYFEYGSLTIRDCDISANTADRAGGGLYASGVFFFSLDHCSVTGNQSKESGGGIYAFSYQSTAIRDCTISGNQATGASGYPASGGGVRLIGALVLERSSISGNLSKDEGGGLSLFAIAYSESAPTWEIANSTISGNQSTGGGAGAGIASAGAYGSYGAITQPLLLRNSTVTANTTSGAGGGIAALDLPPCPVILQSSVVAGNTDNGTGPDIHSAGSVTSKNSAVFNAAGFTLTDLGGTIPAGTDLKLGSLADNGGPTKTHLPLSGSPLIDAGFNAGPSGTDQRGPTFARQAGAAVDIGAAEFGSGSGVPTGSLSNVTLSQPGGTTLSFTVLWADETAIDVGSLGNNNLRVTGPGAYDQPAKLLSTNIIHPSRVEATYSVPANTTGNPSKWDAHDNGVYTVSVQPGSVTDGTNAVAAGAIAAVTVNVPFPAASATASDVSSVELGLPTYSFTVDYAHVIPIAVATIDSLDVRVTGPNGFSQLAVFKGAVPGTDSTTVTATYQITTPGGSWDGTDFGAYSIAVEPGQVTDTDGIAVPAGPIGSFNVYLPQTFVVNATNDESVDTDGKVSLREAIDAANASKGLADTITFDPTVFSSAKTILLASGELLVTDGVTINGLGASIITLDGAGAARHFNIDVAESTGNAVSISGMTLTNGAPASGNGGSILNVDEALTLSKMVITKNTTSNDGGGISVADGAGSLVVTDCVISENTAKGTASNGGGINIGWASSVTITRSTISGNSSGEDGGGVCFFSGGTLTMDDSTVSGNNGNTMAAGAGGAGISLFSTTATIRNSTISGNKTNTAGFDSNGGGIGSFSAILTLRNSTVAFNDAGTKSGGGIHNNGASTISLNSTIVSNNAATTAGPDINGAATLSFSLISNSAGWASVQTQAVPIPIGQLTNVNLRTYSAGVNYPSAPIGLNVGGVPFELAPFGSVPNSLGSIQAPSGISTFVIPVNVFAPAAVYTLMNSAYGVLGANNATLDFVGAGGAFASFDLVQGVNIRDHYNGFYNNTIAPGTPSAQWGGGAVRLDRQTFNLPAAFQNDLLTHIVFHGHGNVPDGNAFMAAISVSMANLTGSNNLVNVDAKLGPLTDNGGPTKTHLPLPGSPVINAGNNAANLATDQRGMPRVNGGAADIGAVETAYAPAVRIVTVNDGSAQRSVVTKLSVTFDQIVTLPASPADAFQLKRASDNQIVALSAAVNQGATTSVTLTFTGGPLNGASLADGRYTLTVFAGQVSNANGVLDGNADGTGGDDYVQVGGPSSPSKLFRLFGDADGDGDVDGTDFAAFRDAFGSSSNLAFDSDGDGDVDAVDFGQFRQRFGSSV